MVRDLVLFGNLIALIALICLARFYLPSYFKKKAENLAQKEDLEALTKIVESVQIQFAKTRLVHKVQFQAEFKYYEKVWASTHELHQCFVELNPKPAALLARVEKPNQATFDRFLDAHHIYAETLDSCKPFISEKIWSLFDAYDHWMITDKVKSLNGIPTEDIDKYRAGERQSLEECATAIRERLSSLLTA